MFSIKHYAYYTRDNNGNLNCSPVLVGEPVALSGLTGASLSVELNTAGVLDLTIPYGNIFYDIFELYVSELAVFQGNKEIWRGYVSEISRDFDGNKTVKAEGILAYLSMSVKKFNKNTTGVSVSSFLSELANNHNGQVGPDSGSGRMPNRNVSIDPSDISGTVVFDEDTEYDTTWSYIENKLLDEFSGFIKIWRHEGTNKISYKKASGITDTSITQKIRFGSNLLDLDITYNTEDFMTLVYAKGKTQDGDEDQYCSNNPIANDNAVIKYGRIYRFENFEGANGDTNIENAADKKLSDNGIIYRIEANALDLHNNGNNVDAIELGNHHNVICPHCGLDGTEDFCVEKIDYDLLYWEDTTFTFGRTEKIWVIEHDDPIIFGQKAPLITQSSAKSLKGADMANRVASQAMSRASECMTSTEVTAAIDAAIASAKTEIQTPLVSNISVNGTTMTCDITVGQFVDAVAAGKGILVRDNDDIYSVYAGYAYINGAYSCTLIVAVTNETYVSGGLSAADTLVLNKMT